MCDRFNLTGQSINISWEHFESFFMHSVVMYGRLPWDGDASMEHKGWKYKAYLLPGEATN